MARAAGIYRERTLSAHNGLRLYYRDYGDPRSARVPLVCLAGLTRNSKDFDGLAGRVAAERRAICPDYRGRGRSDHDPDWRNYRPRVILNDVIQLLAANNLHRVVICGVSFGGLLAMALAVAAPTALAGVILNDIGPEVSPAGTERILDFISHDRPQPDWEAAVADLRANFSTLSFSTEKAWRRFAEATYREGADGRLHFDWDLALVKPLRETRGQTQDFWPFFRALRRLPVLAIRGGLSDVLSEATFARMATEKPDLIAVTLPGIGHVPTLDEPEARRAVDDFLSRIDG